jgi:hypothetical protein
MGTFMFLWNAGTTWKSIRCYNSENQNLHIHRHENIKSHVKFAVKLPAHSCRREGIWETLSLAGLAVWECNRPRAWKRIGIRRLREKFTKEWWWVSEYWRFKDGGLWSGRVRNHSYRPAWIGLLKWRRRGFSGLDRLEVFTPGKMTIVVFRVVTACGLVRGYQCFGETYHLYIRGNVLKSA